MKTVKTFVGFKPTDYQLDTIKLIHNNRKNNTVISVLACRQVGKSLLNLNVLLDEALNNTSISMYIAPSFKQSKKLYKELKRVIGDTDLIKNTNATDMIIDFINGSQIIFGSAGQGDGLRGYTISGILIIDEARDISDDVYYSILLPMVRVHKATILITSTPRYKNGFFYYNYLKEGDNFKSIDYTKYDLSRFLTNDYKIQAKQDLPTSAYITEVLGEFLDDESTVFGEVNSCVVDTITNRKIESVGIDWSLNSGNDNTVVSGLNSECGLVEQLVINNISTTEAVDRIATYLNGLGSHKINVLSELNSIGTVYFDLLKGKLKKNINLQGFNTNNTSKNAIISKLQVKIQNKEITWENNIELLNELKTYTLEYNPKTRVVTYNAADGCKDDRVISIALANEAFDTMKTKCDYRISVR